MSPRNPETEHSSPDQEPESEKAREIPQEEPKETSAEAQAPAPDALTALEQEQADHWLMQEAQEEVMRAAEKSPEQAEKERLVAEVEALFETWLAPEKLEHLNGLTEEAEAMADPVRTEAKLALKELLTRKKKLVDVLPAKDISEIDEKRTRIGKAVGMINGGKVDHTRG
jgi:16S rRNA C967 or C1407 C5-methylase (RsmB/RsmF family)